MQIAEKKPHALRDRILTIIAFVVLYIILRFSKSMFSNGSYVIRILNQSAIYAISALGLNLINGFAGQFSLGQAGFMAVGGYVTAILSLDPATKQMLYSLEPIYPWLQVIEFPFIAALIVGGIVAALFAFLIGFPVLRLRGDYLAIASLGFAEIIRVFITKMPRVTNGALGLKGLKPVPKLFEGVPILDTIFGESQMTIFLILILVVVFLNRLMKTSYGRTIKAVRDDEIAAQAMGVNLFSRKMTAFVISGFLAGIAGGLLSGLIGAIDPEQYKYILTYNILLMVVLGGMGSNSGSVVGAFIVTIALEALRVIDEPFNLGPIHYPGISGMRMVVFSALLMIVIIYWNHGIFGTKEFSWEWLIGGIQNFFRKIFRRPAQKNAQDPEGKDGSA